MTDDNPDAIDDVPPLLREDDPYGERDLSEFPEWWRRNIEEFREFGLPPYKPPVFLDGALVPERVAALEERLGVEIRIRTFSPQTSDAWEIVVDGEAVATVERRRRQEGFPLLVMTASEFAAAVEGAVES